MDRKRVVVESTTITATTGDRNHRRKTRDERQVRTPPQDARRRGPPSPHSKRTAGMCPHVPHLVPCDFRGKCRRRPRRTRRFKHPGFDIEYSICGSRFVMSPTPIPIPRPNSIAICSLGEYVVTSQQHLSPHEGEKMASTVTVGCRWSSVDRFVLEVGGLPCACSRTCACERGSQQPAAFSDFSPAAFLGWRARSGRKAQTSTRGKSEVRTSHFLEFLDCSVVDSEARHAYA